MVTLKEYGKYVWNNLKARKLRSWLTIMGIIIGIGAMVSLITLSNAMNTAVQTQFEKMGISAIRVVPAGLNGPPTGSLGLPLDIQEKIEDVIGVEYANPVIMNNARLEFNKEEEQVLLTSYDTSLSDKAFVDTDLQTKEGRFFRQGEKGAIILGYDVAYELFDKDIGVKNSVLINEEKFEVVGILADSGTDADDRVYMPLEESQRLLNKYDEVNVFVVQVEEGLDTTAIGARIEQTLLRTLDENEFDVFTPEQLLKQIGAIIGIVQIVLGAIASISLIVGSIGIMNSMFTAVLERTQEIGVMKAIGGTRKEIVFFFVIEAGAMGLIGGMIGTLLGTLISFIVQFGAEAAGYSVFVVTINPMLIINILILSFVVGLVAGIIPAFRAAQMKPIDALRYE